MIEVAVVVRNSTLAALTEHSVRQVGPAMPLSESQSIILLTADVLRGLLDRARPEDTRLDDVIMRLAT